MPDKRRSKPITRRELARQPVSGGVTSAPPASSLRGRWHQAAALAILVVAISACFGGALSAGFVIFDDAAYTSQHHWVRSGLTLSGIAAAFRGDGGIYWHPLTWVSHMLDNSLFGLDGGWHHMQSIFWHLGCAVILLFLGQRFGLRVWAALAFALLWALHPLRVESVAWVAERKDVLCGFFWLLAVWLYTSYVAKPGPARYAAMLGAAALAYLAKPTAITLPFVLLLLDWWPLRRQESWRRLLLEKAPLLVFSAAISWVTYSMQQAEGAFTLVRDTSLFERFQNAAVAYCWYLGKTLWPTDLAVLYPYPKEIGSALWTGAVFLLAGLTALAMQNRDRFPALLTGWLSFVGVLVPMIGLVQAGPQPYADRFSYLASVFLLFGLVWVMTQLADEGRIPAGLLGATGVLLVATLGARSFAQVQVWKDSETLFRHAIGVTGTNPYAQMNLGAILIARKEYGEALEPLRAALSERPNYAPNHFNLGQAYFGLGNFLPARSRFAQAAVLDPVNGDAWIWLGNTEDRLGNAEAAISALERGLAAGGSELLRMEARNTLGILFAGKNRHAEAEAQFRAALAAAPHYENARINLAVLLARMDRKTEAVREANEVLRRNPGHGQAQALVRALSEDARERTR